MVIEVPRFLSDFGVTEISHLHTCLRTLVECYLRDMVDHQ